MSASSLIGIDWGSTSLRAYLMDRQGDVLEARTLPWGVRQLPAGGFETALAQLVSGWPACPMLASGMVGSRQGWMEVPYVELPADLATVAASMRVVEIAGRPGLSIVPGLHSVAGPDVMRGEETEVFGAIALHAELHDEPQLVLPGTHSKWVAVHAGRIEHFATVMTGELYALLRRHSVLGAGLPDEVDVRFHEEAFLRGVACVRDSGAAGALARLFSARALLLGNQLSAAEVPDYLSGLLIGEELRIASASGWFRDGQPMCLIGEHALCVRYVHAADCFGWPTPRVIEGAAARGLWEIAHAAGWMDGVAAATATRKGLQ